MYMTLGVLSLYTQCTVSFECMCSSKCMWAVNMFHKSKQCLNGGEDRDTYTILTRVYN